jgi:hypothetical protein
MTTDPKRCKLQESSNDLLFSTPYAFAVFFVILWCCISFLIGVMSGWHMLAERFKKQSEPYGETRSAGPFFYSVYTRYWSHYGNAIRITAAEDALYFSILFLFRVGHPPLSIPWSEIKLSRTKCFWRSYVVLTLGEQEQIPMRIPECMASKLGIMGRLPTEIQTN